MSSAAWRRRMVWPGAVTYFFSIFGERYAVTRLFMLGVAVLVGVLLWLWLTRTRMGMVIRAGVDDRQMVRALGINIRLVFAMTFFVGSFLAGLGGVLGASFAGAAPGIDGSWLLNSLVVVIIGGMGSLKGAAAGSLLYGTVVAFAPGIPAQRVLVLRHHRHLRPARDGAGDPALRAVREAGMRARALLTRGNLAFALLMVVLFVIRHGRVHLLHQLRADADHDPRDGRSDDRVPGQVRRDDVAGAAPVVREWPGSCSATPHSRSGRAA